VVLGGLRSSSHDQAVLAGSGCAAACADVTEIADVAVGAGLAHTAQWTVWARRDPLEGELLAFGGIQ
jgi:hypothetical protein